MKNSLLKRFLWFLMLCLIAFVIKTGKDYYDMKKYNILRNTDCLIYGDNISNYIFSFDKKYMDVYYQFPNEKCAKGKYKIIDDNKIEIQFTSVYKNKKNKRQFDFSQKKYICSYKGSREGIIVKMDDEDICFDILDNYRLAENVINGYWIDKKEENIVVFTDHIMYWIKNGQIVNTYGCKYAKQILIIEEVGITISIFDDCIAEFEVGNSDDRMILKMGEEIKTFKRKKGTYGSDIIYEFIKGDFFEDKYGLQPYEKSLLYEQEGNIIGQRFRKAVMWSWRILEQNFVKNR